MLTPTQEQILANLISYPENQLTISGTAITLGKSYTLTYNNIVELEKKQIVKLQDVPPAKVVLLNEFAPIDVLIDVELKRKKEFLQKNKWVQIMLQDILSYTKNYFFILLVFGSYAKGTQTKKSDIDLLIIVQDKHDIKKIENAIRKVYTQVKKGVNVVDVSDFKEMVRNTNELNIGNEAKKHHIILYGVENYYQLTK